MQALASELEENVKTEKAHGTRWLQHKRNAIKALLRSYTVIVEHFEDLSADSSPFKGYLTCFSTV